LAEKAGFAIFRVHEPPREESLENVRYALARLGLQVPSVDALMHGGGLQEALAAAAGTDKERYVNMLVLRSMNLARYEPASGLHFGLGFEHYTHFTSPIRRYADLLVHRRLKRLIRGDRRKSGRERIGQICSHISEQERRAESAEREMVSFHKTLFMKDKIGERYTGHISGATSFGMFVELEENFVEGMVPLESMTDDWYKHLPEEHALLGERTGRRLRLGDPVTIRVVAVDLARREVTFQLLAGGTREVPRGAQTRVRRTPSGLKRPQRAPAKKNTARKRPARRGRPPRKRR
jgi:ribonuclease R